MLIKKLKEKLLDLEGSVKEAVVDVADDFDAKAVTMEIDDDGNFHAVVIEYSKKSGRGRVVKSTPFEKRFSMAIRECQKIMAEEIVTPQQRKK